jgi:hypothetical protein
MGNRAVITVAPYAETNIGIYLHWNGGRESIEGFLAAAKALGMRSPGGDPTYAMARLVQIIGNFFGGSTSIGIGLCGELDCDNGDNGTYVIGGDWEIMARLYCGEDGPVDEDSKAAIKAGVIEKTKGFM